MNFTASVLCLTYNHAPYIVDAMNGFCIQKTNFPYVTIIVDDASSDGTQTIIKEYLNKYFDFSEKSGYKTWETDDAEFTFIRHKTNINCYFVVVLLKYNYYRLNKSKFPLISEWYDHCKYIAFCEGDDYWISQHKLQKQVDFLNEHDEYGLVYTDYNRLDQLKAENFVTESMFHSGKMPIILSFNEHLSRRGYIAPMSWVFRSKYRYIGRNYEGKVSVDSSFIMALELMLQTKVYFLDEVTSVYRVHWGSATHQKSDANRMLYDIGLYNIQSYYLEKCKLSNTMPECRDWFYWPYYRYIIATNEKEKIEELKKFFIRRKKVSIRAWILSLVLSSAFGLVLLQYLYKYCLLSSSSIRKYQELTA